MNENPRDSTAVVEADPPSGQHCSALKVVQSWNRDNPGVGDIEWDLSRLEAPAKKTDL